MRKKQRSVPRRRVKKMGRKSDLGRIARVTAGDAGTRPRFRRRYDAFISYASQDETEARRLAEAMKNLGLEVWYAPLRLRASAYLPKEIRRGLRQSRLGVVILSHSYFAKKWPRWELDEMARAGVKVVPVWHQISLAEIEEQGIKVRGHRLEHILHAGETSHGPDALATRLDQILNPSRGEPAQGRSPRPSRAVRLADRLGPDHWTELRQAAVSAATAGGMAAMYNYRRPENKIVGPPRTVASPNPSTDADYQATAEIIRTIGASLLRFTQNHGAALLVLGEETVNAESLALFRFGDVQNCIKAPEHFFTENDSCVRVILDGIDGTGSFMRGIPLFCTAVAILVANQVRVSAVYDPIHHVVYSGALEGKYEHPEARVWAEAWNVATGNRLQLPRPAGRNGSKPALRDEAVGIHFTRSNHERLKDVLRPRTSRKDASSTIERIARGCAGVYALNSGVLAMAEVAGGGLGAFVNNVTNLWDVAAGEVLVRACGGKVTEFSGAPIDYSVDKKISVAAAKQSLHSSVLSIINDDL